MPPANAPATQQTLERRADSPAGPPDPYEDSPGYLRFHGWKCLGDPKHPTAGWVDPTRPMTARESRVPIMVRDRNDKTGKTMKQLQVPTGESAGQRVPGERVVYHPATPPMTLQMALRTQMEREMYAAEAKMQAAAR